MNIDLNWTVLPSTAITDHLLPLLSAEECHTLTKVCHSWRSIINSYFNMKLLSKVTFGKREWLKIPGVKDVGDEPILTEDQQTRLIGKLRENCASLMMTDGRVMRIWETNVLLFLPKTINGQPRNKELLARIFLKNQIDDPNFFAQMMGGGDQNPDQAFVLFSKYAVPSTSIPVGSRAPTLNETLTALMLTNIGKECFCNRKGNYACLTANAGRFEGSRILVSNGLFTFYDNKGNSGLPIITEVIDRQ